MVTFPPRSVRFSAYLSPLSLILYVIFQRHLFSATLHVIFSPPTNTSSFLTQQLNSTRHPSSPYNSTRHLSSRFPSLHIHVITLQLYTSPFLTLQLHMYTSSFLYTSSRASLTSPSSFLSLSFSTFFFVYLRNLRRARFWPHDIAIGPHRRINPSTTTAPTVVTSVMGARGDEKIREMYLLKSKRNKKEQKRNGVSIRIFSTKYCFVTPNFTSLE